MTATDAALTALGLCAWAFFFFRYWRVANHIDRYEGIILRPLSISVDLIGLHYLLNKAWWAAAIALFWGIFWIGGVVGGATLRRDRTSGELANPPKPVVGGELPVPSHEESRLIGMAVLKLSWMGFIPEMLLAFHHGLRWYTAVAASVVASIVIGPVLALVSFWTASATLKRRQPSESQQR